MLNKLKLTLPLATILALCARVSRAQDWNDEEVKQAQKCDDGFEWKSWTSVVDTTKTEALPGWRMFGGHPLPPGPGVEGGLALSVTQATNASGKCSARYDSRASGLNHCYADYPFLLSDSK